MTAERSADEWAALLVVLSAVSSAVQTVVESEFHWVDYLAGRSAILLVAPRVV